MNDADFLLWVRGPGMIIAVAVFVFGVLVRFLEMWLLGKNVDLAEPKGAAFGAGVRTMFTRSAPCGEEMCDGGFVLFSSWAFHIAFVLIFLFLAPHILFLKSILGFGWPALPKALMTILAIIGIISMVALLVHRFFHAVRNFLGKTVDYVAWTATFLPLLTGYLAAHSPLFGYSMSLALHILSFEIFIVLIPFTKLMHMFTVWVARYINGAAFGRKGVAV
jgi:nitrate reductase gamma subunit